MVAAPRWSFGPFRLDLVNSCLWHSTQEIFLKPKTFAVLHHLAEVLVECSASDASSDCAPTAARGAVPLAGREVELACLHTWLDKSLRGERQVVFVTGYVQPLQRHFYTGVILW
jgi:hypothetical protein